MPKAFKRIDSKELKDCLDNNELPQELIDALQAAVKAAEDNPYDEFPIEVFIVCEPEAEDEDEVEDE